MRMRGWACLRTLLIGSGQGIGLSDLLEQNMLVVVKSRILDQPLCKKYSSLESRSTSPHFVRFRLTRLLAPHIFLQFFFIHSPFIPQLAPLASSFILREIKRNVVNLGSCFLPLLQYSIKILFKNSIP